jgi:hypothetical protein
MKILQNFSGFLRGRGVLDGQACSWNKSLLTGESCKLQILKTRLYFLEVKLHIFLPIFWGEIIVISIVCACSV